MRGLRRLRAGLSGRGNFYQDDVPTRWSAFTADSATFFTDALPGQSEPLGSPGGAANAGPFGADTPLVAGHPSGDGY